MAKQKKNLKPKFGIDGLVQGWENTTIGSFDPYDSTGRSGAATRRTAGREGLSIVLTAIPGLTSKDVLETPFFFQCPPLEQFTVEYGFNHVEYDTIRAGTFSRKGGRSLRLVSFDTLTVDWGLFAFFNFEQIEAMRDRLIALTESGEPFEFTAHHSSQGSEIADVGWPELQMAATLRDLQVIEKAGEGDARYYTAQFSEYRDPVADRQGRGGAGGQGGAGGPGGDLPTFVSVFGDGDVKDAKGKTIGTVEKPSSMESLARAYYGDGQQWRNIALKNNLTGWGATDKLYRHPRFQKLAPKQSDKVKIPNIPVKAGAAKTKPKQVKVGGNSKPPKKKN